MVQTESEPAFEKAQRLAAAIRERPFAWDGHEIALEVAHGVYAFKPGESVNDALAPPTRRCTRKSSRPRPPVRKPGPAAAHQAMMSGRMSLSRRAI